MKYFPILVFLIFVACNSTDQEYKEAIQGTWIKVDNPSYIDEVMIEPEVEPESPFRNPVFSFNGDSIYYSNSYFYYDGENDSIEYFGDYSTFEIKDSILYYEYPKNNKMEPILKINKVTKDTIFSERYLLVRQKVNTNLLDFDEIRFSVTYYDRATIRTEYFIKKNGNVKYKEYRNDVLTKNEVANINKKYLQLVLSKVNAVDFTEPKKQKKYFIVCGEGSSELEFYKNNKLVHKDDLKHEDASPAYYDLTNRLISLKYHLEDIKSIK